MKKLLAVFTLVFAILAAQFFGIAGLTLPSAKAADVTPVVVRDGSGNVISVTYPNDSIEDFITDLELTEVQPDETDPLGTDGNPEPQNGAFRMTYSFYIRQDSGLLDEDYFFLDLPDYVHVPVNVSNVDIYDSMFGFHVCTVHMLMASDPLNTTGEDAIRVDFTDVLEAQTINFEFIGEFWFEARIAPLVNTPSDKTPCVLWIARDISTRKELKVQLSDSENRYRDLYRTVRLMVNNATDLIWAKDMNDCYTFVNRATCDVLLQARTLDEPIGKNDLFFALRERKDHPEDPNWHTFGELCQASDRIVRESGKPGQFDEFGNINGQFLYLDVHKAPVRDESGEMIGTVGSARDVTRIRMMESTREQVEEQLRQSETSYRELFDLAPEAIYVQNPDGVFLDVNQHACDMYGHPKSFFIGRTPAALSAEGHNDLETVEQMVGEAFEGKTHTFEFWGKRSNGEIFPKEVIIKPGHYFGEQVVIAFSRDISARKAAEKERQELESQLRHAQKLEAVGRLAGGIAHDFNNLLTPIMGHGDMMLQMLPAKHPFREKLGSILTAADSARKLTQQLLAFGRKQILSTQKVDLNERVKHTIQLLERTLGENIRIQTTLCTEPPLVNADPTQLEQILMNLAINGRDAMPDGGVLSIETAVLTDTNEISLRVTDTGIGMDEDVMLHIFEPFFTTKNVQQGTGLGLSTVYGIVKQHRGNIQVASEPGKGSTFTINLPAADPCAEAVAGDPDIQPITDTQQKSGRILLVEDNPMILDLARNILNQHGYKVCSANRAEKARQIMEQEAHIDLLVTDVVMPGTNGIQLAGQLREYRPDLKVLFITGHAEEMVPEHELSAGRSELLPKPFTVQTLMTAVQSLLD